LKQNLLHPGRQPLLESSVYIELQARVDPIYSFIVIAMSHLPYLVKALPEANSSMLLDHMLQLFYQVAIIIFLWLVLILLLGSRLPSRPDDGLSHALQP
jgi:hypothetical protein